MRSLTITVLSWCALALLAGAFAVWWFVPVFLESERNEYARAVTNADQHKAREAAVLRVAELVRETADARTRLDALTATDVLSAAKKIESVGPLAQITLRVSGASSANASPLRAIVFSFEGQGTFAHVMHAVALLDALPLSSTIEQFEISKADSDTGTKGASTSWGLKGRIRLLTAASMTQ